jgi:hypothetical protein
MNSADSVVFFLILFGIRNNCGCDKKVDIYISVHDVQYLMITM